MSDNIHAGHRKRMRNRFDAVGMEGWSDHEVLEYMLFPVFKRCDTNELAHRLIDECGSLEAVLNASQTKLVSIHGVGDACASYIRSLGGFFQYMTSRPSNGMRLNKTNTSRYIKRLFEGRRHECFYLILLDKNMCIISSDMIFEGNFSHVNVDIKSITQKVVRADAAFVIAAHNHPSGVLAPSQADIQTTQIIREALSLFGSKLLEHYIVSGNEQLGILEYIEKLKRDCKKCTDRSMA